jgi:hypothetical protein
MKVEQLSPILVRFDKPVHGYWDGGTRTRGTFAPTLHSQDNPKASYVKWGDWSLNYWFNLPLHTRAGKPLSASTIMRQARTHLRKVTTAPATII